MKKILLPLLLSCFLIACNQTKQSGNTAQQATVTAPQNALTMEFQIHGMVCTDCENTINKSVQSLPGVDSVRSSYQDSMAVVVFDKTRSTPDDVKKAIEAKGYEVKGWKTIP